MSIPTIMAALMGGDNNSPEKKQKPKTTEGSRTKIKLSVFFNNESLVHHRIVYGQDEVDRLIGIFTTKGVKIDEKCGKIQTRYPAWSINKFVIEEVTE